MEGITALCSIIAKTTGSPLPISHLPSYEPVFNTQTGGTDRQWSSTGLTLTPTPDLACVALPAQLWDSLWLLHHVIGEHEMQKSSTVVSKPLFGCITRHANVYRI